MTPTISLEVPGPEDGVWLSDLLRQLTAMRRVLRMLERKETGKTPRIKWWLTFRPVPEPRVWDDGPQLDGQTWDHKPKGGETR